MKPTPDTSIRTDPTIPDSGDTPPDRLGETDRRAALTKLGALAAWTAPTTLTLLLSPRRSAASPDGPPNW